MILSRFATTFRNDVHAAQSAEVDAGRTPGQGSILLRLDSPRIVSYTAEPNGVVVRTVQKGTLVERREEFRLSGTQTQFGRNQKNSTAAAVHRLHAATIAGGPVSSWAASAIRIEAVIGRDRRFDARHAVLPQSRHRLLCPRGPPGRSTADHASFAFFFN